MELNFHPYKKVIKFFFIKFKKPNIWFNLKWNLIFTHIKKKIKKNKIHEIKKKPNIWFNLK